MTPRLRVVLTVGLAAGLAVGLAGACKDASLPASPPDAQAPPARVASPPPPAHAVDAAPRATVPVPDAASAAGMTATGKTPESPSAAAAAAAGGKIGVPACEEYLDKMARCINHLAADAQGPMREGLDESRAAWQKNAATPEGKKALEPTCKQALEVAKSAAAAMGCEW